jgi:hypothetical protein
LDGRLGLPFMQLVRRGVRVVYRRCEAGRLDVVHGAGLLARDLLCLALQFLQLLYEGVRLFFLLAAAALGLLANLAQLLAGTPWARRDVYWFGWRSRRFGRGRISLRGWGIGSLAV